MSFLLVIKASKLIPLLLRAGFRAIRQKGSHIQLEHIIEKTRKVTIPIHNKDLPVKTLLSILKQAKISLDEFLKILGK